MCSSLHLEGFLEGSGEAPWCLQPPCGGGTGFAAPCAGHALHTRPRLRPARLVLDSQTGRLTGVRSAG